MPQSPKRRLRQHWLIGQIRRIVQTQIRRERLTQLVRHCRRQAVSALVVSAVVLGVAGNAAAQTGGIKAHTPRVAGAFGYSACGVSGYVCGHSPYSYASTFITPDPYGGYLRGTADVIHAQGSYLVNTQQAYLTREQVRAAQVENRRRLFADCCHLPRSGAAAAAPGRPTTPPAGWSRLWASTRGKPESRPARTLSGTSA